MARTMYQELQAYLTGLIRFAFLEGTGEDIRAQPLDYLNKLLMRVMRTDQLFPIKGYQGKHLMSLADMIAAAEKRIYTVKREAYRQVGDTALLCKGVFPGIVRRLQRECSKDSALDYIEQGRRAYSIAMTLISKEEHKQENETLRQLRDQFELYVTGLDEVRKHLYTPRAMSGKPLIVPS